MKRVLVFLSRLRALAGCGGSARVECRCERLLLHHPGEKGCTELNKKMQRTNGKVLELYKEMHKLCKKMHELNRS